MHLSGLKVNYLKVKYINCSKSQFVEQLTGDVRLILFFTTTVKYIPLNDKKKASSASYPPQNAQPLLMGQSHDFSRAYSLFVARVASFAPERSEGANDATRGMMASFIINKQGQIVRT